MHRQGNFAMITRNHLAALAGALLVLPTAALAAHAGAPFEKGKGADGTGEDMMYPSTMFRVHGVDPVRAGDAWNHFGRLMEAAEAKGRSFPRKAPIIRSTFRVASAAFS